MTVARRWIAAGALGATALAATALTGVALTASATGPEPHAVAPLRDALTQETFYFVMADRFANGDASNDTGGYGDDPMVSGFDPTDAGFYQGGDLAGLMERLDYIEGLGTTAIWLTPSFTNKPVQPEDSSAGYHGYWITDFTSIDPHLGTNDELAALVDEAHDRGIKVFFDIITNHTADVIGYESGDRVDYISKDERPYTDAAGEPFDDRAVAGTDAFPALDPATSFPLVPVLEPGEEDAKTPAWLNDVTRYHHRGNTTFTGEDSQYGDFFGLDDLFTEDPVVVDGMIDIYTTWIEDFGIDGFRIDTVKHVDDAFWQRFGPEVLEAAHEAGKDDFLMFGEVFDTSRAATSHYTTRAQLQSVLDFPFQEAARAFASGGGSADALAGFFADDDWYTDADSNAYQLPTFLGNHDMGRIGSFLATDNPDASDEELLRRDVLAHELMFLSRGNPVIYYGDEQGFTGAGGDKDARQTLFASQVDMYLDDDLLGTEATHADDTYDVDHPLYQRIGALAELASEHPALADGAHQNRLAEDEAGVYAFSRMDRDDQREYVVAVNNATEERTVTFDVWAPKRSYKAVYGDGASRIKSGADGAFTVTVPALSTVVYESAGRVPTSKVAPAIEITGAEPSAVDASRMEVTAEIDGNQYAEVSFWARAGEEEWTHLGTDDSAPYRVFDDVLDLNPGDAVEYVAVVADNKGHTRTSAARLGTVPEPRVAITSPAAGSRLGDSPVIVAEVTPLRSDAQVTFERRVTGGDWVDIGTDTSLPAFSVTDDLEGIEPGTGVEYRATATSGGVSVVSTIISAEAGAEAQPGEVSLPGSFNQVMGCGAVWMPECDQAQMTLDEDALTWSIAVDLEAGTHQYKVAIDRSWAENYGVGGVRDGANYVLVLDEPATVTFTYDHATREVTTAGGSGGGPTGPSTITLVGSLQSALGCGEDWDPTCAATAMTADGSGGWNLTGTLQAGTWEYKVAYDGTWDVDYGADGQLGGSNMILELPQDATVTFSHDEASHLTTATVG